MSWVRQVPRLSHTYSTIVLSSIFCSFLFSLLSFRFILNNLPTGHKGDGGNDEGQGEGKGRSQEQDAMRSNAMQMQCAVGDEHFGFLGGEKFPSLDEDPLFEGFCNRF